MAKLFSNSDGTSYSLVMHGIYTHVAAGTGPITFAAQGGNTALYNGTSFATPSGASFWDSTGAYMVLQGSHPGGGVWQVRIKRTGASTIATLAAPNGGYISASHDFSGSLVGTETTTFSTTPASGDLIYVGSNNSDTYNSGLYNYSYIYAIFWDNSAGSFTMGFYIGGYLPSKTDDGSPFVLLRTLPIAISANSRWGMTSASANNNETWSSNAHNGLTWGGANSSISCDTWQLDFDSVYFKDVIRVSSGASNMLGTFGQHTMRRVSSSVANRTRDANNLYIVCAGFLLRYED